MAGVPKAADGCVAQDFEQPGPQIGSRDELLSEAERSQISVLNQILRIGRVSSEAEGRAVERVDVLERLIIGERGFGRGRWLA